MKHFLLIISLCILSSTVCRAQQWVDKSYPYDSIRNINYGTAVDFAGNTQPLSLDLFLPNNDNRTRRPLLVWIHGGGFINGSKDDASIQRLCREFARRGYVTASISYRLGYVSDDQEWTCNLPDYSCLFVTDSAEWGRAYYRSVQDAKGAIRFLVNRREQYKIDEHNIFVAGESAGAFTALGVGLLDVPAERPPQTYALPDAPVPHPSTANCNHNLGKTFNGPIARPDLGDIEGDIEPTAIPYTIKGIGNMFGGMFRDLLELSPPQKHKPAIFSFHQPCDLLVPIDSNNIYWGVTWCLTNGYNCYGIAHTNIQIYGARAFSKWNDQRGYNYVMENRFTTVEFPYNYFFGAGSCADQVVNGAQCHAYDNASQREQQLAVFFAGQISTNGLVNDNVSASQQRFTVYPNPADQFITVASNKGSMIYRIEAFDVTGKLQLQKMQVNATQTTLPIAQWPSGLYYFKIADAAGDEQIIRWVKQ